MTIDYNKNNISNDNHRPKQQQEKTTTNYELQKKPRLPNGVGKFIIDNN